MFKWSEEASVDTKATPKRIWELWADVSTWNRWDEALEWSKLDGAFKNGTAGQVKPKGWPKTNFRLVSIEPSRAFRIESPAMPLTKITFTHSIEPSGQGQFRLTHHAIVKGVLAPLLILTMRKKLRQGLKEAVQNLASVAEQKE